MTSWSASSSTSTNAKATSSRYPVVTVETGDGQELAFHAFHTVARNELAKQRPVIGDRIGVAYHGKRDGKNYESYRVIVERTEAELKTIDWDKHRHSTTEPRRTSELEDDDDDPKGREADDGDIPY